MLPIIFAARFLRLLLHLLHSDNDGYDLEEIVFQMQGNSSSANHIFKVTGYLGRTGKQHTDPPLSL